MTIYSGFSHEKWWFSIAIWHNQRVGLTIQKPRENCDVVPADPSLWDVSPTSNSMAPDTSRCGPNLRFDSLAFRDVRVHKKSIEIRFLGESQSNHQSLRKHMGMDQNPGT